MATKKDLEDVVLKVLDSPQGQEFMANAFAKALRDGPVARREFKELVLEALASTQGIKVVRSLIAMAFRDSNPLRREFKELARHGVWDSPVANKKGAISHRNELLQAIDES